MRRLFTSAALFLGISSAALAVSITFDPLDFGYASNGTYALSTQGNVTGPRTFDATPGSWYSLHVQPGNVGEFSLVDAGGGVYNIVTRNSGSDPTPSAGLASSGSGTTGPYTVNFVTQPVTITRPAKYAGLWEVNWSGSNRRGEASVVLKLPPMYAGQNYEMFVANRPVDVKFNLASTGVVTVTDQQANLSGTWTSLPALGTTGGMQTLALPTLLYQATVKIIGNPRGTNAPQNSWWSLDSEVPSFNLQATSYQANIWCYPGNATLYGDIGGGSWLNGDSTLNVPVNPNAPIYGGGYTETLVRLSTEPGVPSQVFYIFSFPEPNTLALLALGGIALLRRRR